MESESFCEASFGLLYRKKSTTCGAKKFEIPYSVKTSEIRSGKLSLIEKQHTYIVKRKNDRTTKAVPYS